MLNRIVRVGAHGICQKGSGLAPILYESSWRPLESKDGPSYLVFLWNEQEMTKYNF